MIRNVFNILSKLVKRFSAVLIWFFSITLTVLILVQMAFVGSVIWLNGDSGQEWLKVQISQANASTGYDIEFSNISYSFPQGLAIQGLTVADGDGLILDMDRTVLRPNLIGFGVHHFGLSMNVDTFTLHRLPKTKEEDTTESEQFALTPFSLPDIYFNSFALDNLNIETLDVKKTVFGTALSVSPSLSSQITLGDVINLDLDLKVKKADIPLPIWMPERISLAGQLNPKSLDLTVEEFTAKNDHTMIQAAGDANLSAQGHVSLTANGRVSDFSPLAEGIEGNAEVEIAISGAFDALALKSTGEISMPLLKERGFSDIRFEVADDDLSNAPLGQVLLEGAYQEKPIKLTATFDMDESTVHIRNITGNAPDLTLSGDVNLNTDTMMADGIIEVTAQNLSTYSAMAGVDIDGQARANITLQHEDNIQGAAIKATVTNAAYEDITLQNAEIATQLSNMQNVWPREMTLTAKGLRPAQEVVIKTLNATLTEQKDGAHVLSLNANGNALQDFKLSGEATLQGLRQADISAQNIDFKLTSKGSVMTLRGQADLETLDVNLNTKNFNLASLPVTLPEQMRELALDADARIHGVMNKPIVTANADLTPIMVAKGARVKISAKGRYENNLARVDVSGSGEAIDTLNGFVQLPLKFSLSPFIFDLPPSTPLKGNVNLAAQANSIAQFTLPVGHKLSGNVKVEGTVAGSIGKPDVSGTAFFKNGTYTYRALGVELFDIDMNANLTPESIKVTNLNAHDGKGGMMSGKGRISFNEPQNTDLDLELKNFRLLDSDKAKGSISLADLTLQGRAQDYLLSGKIDLGQFDIVIPERFQSKIPTLNIVKKDDLKNEKQQLDVVALEMKVTANDHIFVRGWGLDAEFGGQVEVSGSLDDPQLNGTMKSKRGRYEEFGRRFTLERALLRFQGSAPPSPYLDIVATTNADGIQASVNLTGEVSSPSIKLSSVPALPEDEIMSHILFGENLSKITPFQAIQLKQTLDRFTGKGGGGFDPLGKLRDITGLDDIRVDNDEEGDPSVGVGKYLTEDVYLELEKGSGEGSGAAKIQVEVTPSINLESEVGQNAQAGAGVVWKWDY
jgi:translocation and assembly module TamB